MVYSQGTKLKSILTTRQDKHSLAVTFWKQYLYSMDSVMHLIVKFLDTVGNLTVNIFGVAQVL